MLEKTDMTRCQEVQACQGPVGGDCGFRAAGSGGDTDPRSWAPALLPAEPVHVQAEARCLRVTAPSRQAGCRVLARTAAPASAQTPRRRPGPKVTAAAPGEGPPAAQ